MLCKRLTGSLALAAIAAGLAAGGPSAARAASSLPPPRAELRPVACQRALDPPGRSVAVTAVMRPVNGTQRLALRFELERRTRTHGLFTVVRGRDLGKWVSPSTPATLGQNPADVWILTHNVVNLSAPAYYRFRVSYRWLGAGGRVLNQLVRASDVCFEPESRPDLSVRSLEVKPAGPHQDRYTVQVLNGGATAAGHFLLQLRVKGAASVSLVVASLAAHGRVRESFDAPACVAGDTVTAIADPDRQVDDFNRANNALAVPCPSSS